jgi:hypothetical protein
VYAIGGNIKVSVMFTIHIPLLWNVKLIRMRWTENVAHMGR